MLCGCIELYRAKSLLGWQPRPIETTIEFRADGQAFVLDYAGLCGGRGSYAYPQRELVAD